MSLSNLSKQQQQYIVLGLIVLAALGWGIFKGIEFSLASVADAKLELAELAQRIEQADAMLARGGNIGGEFEASVEDLKSRIDRTPPTQNYYSWATEVIYSCGRSSGLEIDSIEEVKRAKSKDDAEKEGTRFESYALRITAHGSFEKTKDFLRVIEQDHPLAQFSGLEISKGANPDSHDIQLFIQWPFEFTEIVQMWNDVAKKQRAYAIRVPQEHKPEDDVRETEVMEPEPVVAVAPKPAPKPVAVPVPEPVVEEPKVVKPEPVVAVAPKPAPKPVAVPVPEPVVEEPKVVKPEPVVAVAPKPAPKPVAVPVPEPVVEEPKVVKPEPVVAVAPKPAPKPVAVPVPEPVVEEPKVVKPEPVVAVAPKPAPKPVAVPVPEPVVEEPKVVKPEPVVAVAPKPAPKPVAVPVPEPVVEEPKFVKPEPVVAAAPKPAPKPVAVPVPEPVVEEPKFVKPEPVGVSDNMDSILASIDRFETTGEIGQQESETEPVTEETKLESLLASLDSHGQEKQGEESVESSTDAASLVALVMELETAPEKPIESKPAPAPEAVGSPIPKKAVVPPVARGEKYAVTPASTEKLKDLLRKDAPKASASLGSFLNGLMEDINE
ncbi:Cytadherence high molecular weight protein 3 [Pontiella desulfatans]|uniref:Cytadherence high molecular weight protein 3 n=1 Tax=Pontiella desulfatans TaxID=2750659 RepID=A0A6C2U5Z9_PONDE|nr:hypothetical protein [Pontiella desulfatans]VGO14951.1 Cytadherence high molecular weight protein 3 [Pontiella desulfatans]